MKKIKYDILKHKQVRLFFERLSIKASACSLYASLFVSKSRPPREILIWSACQLSFGYALLVHKVCQHLIGTKRPPRGTSNSMKPVLFIFDLNGIQFNSILCLFHLRDKTRCKIKKTNLPIPSQRSTSR